MTMINWKTTAEDTELISQIAARAVELAKRMNVTLYPAALHMDIAAAHANGNPLDLAGLLAADDFNFCHDVFGIHKHIDRSNAQLRLFVPRYSKRYSK